MLTVGGMLPGWRGVLYSMPYKREGGAFLKLLAFLFTGYLHEPYTILFLKCWFQVYNTILLGIVRYWCSFQQANCCEIFYDHVKESNKTQTVRLKTDLGLSSLTGFLQYGSRESKNYLYEKTAYCPYSRRKKTFPESIMGCIMAGRLQLGQIRYIECRQVELRGRRSMCGWSVN